MSKDYSLDCVGRQNREWSCRVCAKGCACARSRQGSEARRAPASLGGALLLCAAVAGCTPQHNWREVRHADTGAVVLMPCKPEAAQRPMQVGAAGAAVLTLHMRSCTVGAQTFAWASVQLPPGQAWQPVQQQWQLAHWAALQQPVAPGQTAPLGWQQVAVPTPHNPDQPLYTQWRGPARNHAGEAIAARIQWRVAQGSIHQWAVYGPQGEGVDLTPFFEGWGVGGGPERP